MMFSLIFLIPIQALNYLTVFLNDNEVVLNDDYFFSIVNQNSDAFNFKPLTFNKNMAIQTVNPISNKILMSFDEMTNEEVDVAINKAELAFRIWKNYDYENRASLLNKVAKLLRAKKMELARLITLEMGKPIAQAEGEILLSADIS